MALTAEQEQTILDRLTGGERFPAIVRDMELEQEDVRQFRRDHRDDIKSIRETLNPPDPPESEWSNARISEEITKLQDRKTRAQARIARIDNRIATLQARLP